MKTNFKNLFSIAGTLAVFILPLIGYAQHDHASHTANTEHEKMVGDPYTLPTCPVSGQKLGSMGDPITVIHEGRQIKLCCTGCQAKFEKEPQAYLEKIDKEMIEDQLPYYPLETCVVSGQKLTAMGEPINRIYNNRLVRFCCNNCVAGFEKDPEAFLTKLNAAVIEKQKDSPALKMCPVSNEENGSMGEGINLVIANRLVKLCCPSCEKPILDNPQKYLSKLDSFKSLYSSESKSNEIQHSSEHNH
jgi:YHS domain-containing protein